jgi:hypothetical protein
MTIRAALRVTLSLFLGTAALAAAETTYLPGAAEVTGLAGARFSSTLEISNPGGSGTVATIGLVPMSGKAAPSPVTRTLAAGESLRIPEALGTLFGLADGAAGTLTVTADEPLLANLSTRNVAAPEGAYGLGLLPVASSDLLGAGETGHSIWISQSADPKSGYRTNLSVTLAEPGTVVEVRVLDAEGRVAGTATVTAATPEVWQQPAAALIGPGTDLPVGRAEFEVKAGRATAYAVVNDNVTSDAIALQSERVVPGPTDRLISGAALAPGHLGSFWSTDLRLFNPGSAAVDATVLAVGASREASVVVSVPAKGVVEASRVLALLGFPEGTACALRVTAGASLLVAARTNNVDPAGVRKGTFSAQQFVTAWPDGLLGAGSVGFFNGVDQTLNVPGTRTNLTIVGGPEGAAGELVLRDAAGLEQARAAFSRAPGEWGQLGVADWFSSPAAASAGFRGLAAATIPENARIDVSVASGALDAFVSRIDNGSGDAVTRPVALPGGGDCSKVAITSFGPEPQPVLPGVPTTFSWTVAIDPPSAELTSQSIRFDGEAEIDLGKDARSYTRSFDSSGARSATLTVRKGSCLKSRSVSFSVCGELALEPAVLPNGVAFAAYPSRQLTMPGAAGPVVFAVMAGALPEGLALSPAGVLSGVPEEVGTFDVTVKGTDGNGCTGSRTYTFSVLCAFLEISPSTLPDGTVGIPAAPVQMSVSGGSEIGTWSATGLPPGLTLSPSGLLSGTPTTAGSFLVAVRFVDSIGCEGTASYTVVVCDTLVVTPGTAPAATAGTPYGPFGFAVAGATGAPTWAVTAGALPAGLALDPGTGALSGTPTVVGTFPFTVTATDGLGCNGSVVVSLVVNCPSITVNPASLANGTAGVAYGPVGLTQAGGLGAVTWAVTTGALPAGMTLGADGVLSGTPTVTGTFPFTVTVTDANGCTGSRAYSLTIDCPVIALSPASLGNGTAGVAYGPVALTQTGGVGAVTFAVTAGALPAGLDLSAAGVLSGTPTVVGPFGFTVTATDANGCTGTRVYSLVVDCPVITVNPASVADGTAGVAYPGAPFTQAGGVGTITWSVFAGVLPTGMSLDAATGLLSGTPLETGAFPITVRATDANGCFGDRVLTLTVLCPTIVVNPASVPNGTAGVVYPGATFTQTGGVGAVTWSLFAGALPTGMSLDAASGLLFGTPLQTGAFPITVRATDANGCVGDRTLTLTILCPTIVPSPSAPLGGVEGSAFGPITFSQSGGVGAVLWSSTGTLPAGLTFSAAGILSGTPEAGSAGEYTVTFTATDQNLCAGSVQITFRICPVVTVGPTPLAAFLQGQPYADTLAGSGGAAPYTFAVTAGALPAGVLLDGATGALSGIPTTLGVFDFTITATDANGCTGSRTYTGRVCPVITVTTNLPNGVVGAAYSQALAASGSPDLPYTFSLTGGALPDGVDLVAGVLTGTPTTPGTFLFTITATDANGCTGSRAYTVEVCVAPTITPTPAAVCAGSTGNTADGPAGATTYLWAITNGTITGGASAQTVTYTAGASGNVTLTLTVTSASSCTASTSVDVPINAVPATPTITGVPAGGVCADSTGNTASGPAGATTYAWSITGGTITSTTDAQAVTYTAGASGNVQLTLVVTNASGCSASNSATTAINPAPATPTITGVPAGGVCADSTGNTASGPAGATTYAWSITGGTITSPTNAQGVTYTAGASGSVNLTLVVTNASGCSASSSAAATINANPATPTITPAASAVCTLSTGNTASGPAGATTYLWGITNGTITGGGSTQTVTYTAGASGSVQLTLEVTNASGCSATSSLSVPIDPLPTLLPATGTGFTGTFGTAFSQAFTASGGTGPFTYTISPSTPPAGLGFVGGTLSGSPSATGTFAFSVTATSAAGCASTTQSYTLTVRPNLVADSYSGVGNTQLFVTGVAGAPATPAVASATTAVANDLPTGGVTVTGVVSPCVGLGGTMAIDAAGRFVYTPPAGVTGNDVCTYTATSDTGATGTPASATATITIGLANRVWYVNGAAVAGDGRSNTPFNTLASASTAHLTGDTVFVQSGGTATATPGAITMKATTWLWGQGTALPPVGGITIQNTGATTKPILSGPVTLGGSSVTVSSLDISTSGATGLTDDQGAAITGITVQNNVTVTAANAAAVVLTDVTSSASGLLFTSVSSSGSATSGVSLTNVNGTFTVSGGSIANANGTDFLVSGGAANVSYAGTITDDVGVLVAITSTTGGAKTFTGALTDGDDGDGSGIVLTNNTGATITFSGGLVLSTGGNPAFTATGGGTVNVCDENPCGASGSNGGLVNTLTTTTGTALNVANTTIGASNLEFRRISSTGGSNTGIILDTTGSSGGLKVKGTGTPGSGGTIANKSGADGQTATGSGISLNSTSNVSLAWMQLNDFQNSGIVGRSVTNFELLDSVLSGVIGSTNVGVEGPIMFGLTNPGGANGLLGNGLIRDTKVRGGIEHNVEFYNQSGSMNLTIEGTTAPGTTSGACEIRSNSVALGSDGILMEMQGTATANVTIRQCFFDDNKSQAVQAAANDDSAIDIRIEDSVVRRTAQGNEGFVLSNGANGDLTARVLRNSIAGIGGAAIFVGQTPGNASASSSLTAVIQGNVIDHPATATNSAILAWFTSSPGGVVAPANVLIDGNTVTERSTNGVSRGIFVDTPDANTTPGFTTTITNNSVSVLDNALGLQGIAAQARRGTGCFDIRNNAVTYPNGTPGGVFGLRLRQVAPGAANLEQGVSASAVPVTVLDDNNPATVEVLGTVTVVGNSSCSPPPS